MTRATLGIVASVLLVATAARATAQTNALHFLGHWEVVHGMHDGRFAGASARSFHPGDTLEIDVTGRGFRIFGVTGPNGGRAVVIIRSQPDRTIDFYSPHKRTHVLLYTSPRFATAGLHAAVVVSPSHDPASSGTFVNVDLVEMQP